MNRDNLLTFRLNPRSQVEVPAEYTFPLEIVDWERAQIRENLL